MAACQSASQLTPGTWDYATPDAWRGWRPSRCNLTHAEGGERGICNALQAQGIARVIFVGDSTVSNLFLSVIHDVLPPRPESPDTLVLRPELFVRQQELRQQMPNVSAAAFFRWRAGRYFTRDAAVMQANTHCHAARTSTRDNVDRSCSARPVLHTLVRGNCSYAIRCGGALELLYWYPPNPFGDGSGTCIGSGQIPNFPGEVVAGSLHELAAADRPDAIILGLGTHYMPGFSRDVPQANVTRAYADDLRTIDAAARRYCRHPPTPYKEGSGDDRDGRARHPLIFFTQLRPYPKLKRPRWRQQTPEAAATLNAVARDALGPHVPVLDGFELTLGVEPMLSVDGTHYDYFVLAAQGALLLEALTFKSRPRNKKHAGPRRAEQGRAP